MINPGREGWFLIGVMIIAYSIGTWAVVSIWLIAFRQKRIKRELERRPSVEELGLEMPGDHQGVGGHRSDQGVAW